MAKYRTNLPQLGDKTFLTDSGLETTLIFHDGIDLPHFASIALHATEEGEQRLRDYLVSPHRDCQGAQCRLHSGKRVLARKPGLGREARLSRRTDLIALNRKSIALLAALRDEHETPQCPMPISGNIGPRGDGYSPDRMMTGDEAMRYHAFQCDLFADTEADLISGFTMTHSGEAIGIARAATAVEMPVVISFTTETDGRLPSGETMREAIEKTDDATSGAPAYYMINCAHPTHFVDALEKGEAWIKRLRGLRANASTRSHAELDNSSDLDAGDPVDLGRRYAHLRGALGTRFNILGGCCGTDHRHVAAIAEACLPLRAAA